MDTRTIERALSRIESSLDEANAKAEAANTIAERMVGALEDILDEMRQARMSDG